jgi:hypothetical protein
MPITLMPTIPKVRTSHIPYIVLAVMQLLDVLTTGWILHNWSIRAEGNPVVAAIFGGLGLPLGLTLLLALKLGVVYILWICQSGAKIALTLYTMVLVNNGLFLVSWLLS